jgi:hypothetical protein
MTSPSDYALTIAFSTDDLQRFLAAGSNVVIAKPLIGATVNVAWAVFSPLEHNEISWSEDYVLYASNAEVTNGSRLIPNATTGTLVFAQTDVLYTMAPFGAITDPKTSGGTTGAYSLANAYANTKGFLTLGMM